MDLSTFPNDWGLQAECKVLFMPRVLVIPFVTWDMNTEAFSVCRDLGSPNLDIISLSNNLATLAAISVLVGNTSTHPENISTSTRRYLKLPNQSSCLSQDMSLESDGSYVEASGVSNVRAVHCTDGARLNFLIDYTFHVRSYQDLNWTIIQGFLPLVHSLINFPDGLTRCSLRKQILLTFIN